jgi:[glutamine synthetase] adenylyltransferase / [glutamine synthetase]-adenylyl-L-tyrosine phosphorylase
VVIEFIVQLIQVMRGGKDPSLRQPNTLKAIDRLTTAKLLPLADAQRLSQSLRLFRDVEHALQWYDDQQTHWFDCRASDQSQFVIQLLRTDLATLTAQLIEAREQVAQLFDQAMGTVQKANGLSAAEPDAAAPFAHQERFVRHSEKNQALIKRVWQAGQVLLQDSVAELPIAVATRWERLIETLMGRPGYLAILDQSPNALLGVIQLLAHNEWAANYLIRYPVVIDDLLASDWLEPTDWVAAAAQLREQLLHCRLPGTGEPDVERQVDALREFHHAYTLRLLGQEIAGVLTVAVLADQLSAMADLLIQAAIDCLAPNLTGFAVIAYGKLGAKEMGYASDLDLVFLYDPAPDQNPETYTKLVRKLTHWLTVQTGAGSLFEVDLRLRPDGDAGLVVSSLAAFAQYQTHSAWAWEHQALTRARFCAGDPTVGAAFEALRLAILSTARDPLKTRQSICEMRDKIHAGHPNNTALFDLKHDSGGMVDIEFIVQALVLLYGKQYPELLANKGNVALLALAGKFGLIDPALAEQVGEIYLRLRKAQYDWRLKLTAQPRLPIEDWEQERQTVTMLWNQLFSVAA